jgi:trehalose-6-phosphate synthase
MPLDERKNRWHAMMAVLRANGVHDWASDFLQALANGAEGMEFDEPLRQAGLPNVYEKTLMGSNARSRRSSQTNSTPADA